MCFMVNWDPDDGAESCISSLVFPVLMWSPWPFKPVPIVFNVTEFSVCPFSHIFSVSHPLNLVLVCSRFIYCYAFIKHASFLFFPFPSPNSLFSSLDWLLYMGCIIKCHSPTSCPLVSCTWHPTASVRCRLPLLQPMTEKNRNLLFLENNSLQRTKKHIPQIRANVFKKLAFKLCKTFLIAMILKKKSFSSS